MYILYNLTLSKKIIPSKDTLHYCNTKTCFRDMKNLSNKLFLFVASFNKTDTHSHH